MTSPAAPELTNGEHGGLNEWTPASLGPLARLPIQWAIPGILLLGQPGILAGPTAEGKTTLSMQLAAGKAAGSDVFGIPVTPAPVLFIELEDSPTVIAKRLEYITEGFSATQQQLLQENFRIWTPGAGLDPRFTSLATAIYKRLLDLGVKEAGGGVVVIDTLLAVSEGDENAAGAHRELWAIATWLAQELNVVVVFLHHTRKRDPKAPWNNQGLEAVRGSSAQVGSARFVLQLSKTGKVLEPEGGKLAKLTMTKINSAPPGFTLDLVQDPRTGLWSRLEDNEPRGSITRGAAYRARSPTPEIPVRKRLLQLLADTAKGEALPSRQQLSINLFGDADHASLAKLRAAFRDLRLKGWVDPDHNRLTPAGHLALNTASTASISTPQEIS